MAVEEISVLQAMAAAQRREAENGTESALSELGPTLADLCRALVEGERYDEATTVGTELVSLARQLVERNANRYQKLLGRALSGLAGAHYFAGRPAEALPPLQEAVGLARPLQPGDGDGAMDLANRLSNLGDVLNELGHTHEALAAAEEAVDVVRTVFDRGPSEHADLAIYLAEYSSLLSDLGRTEEALTNQTEAVALLAGLCQVDREEYLGLFASELNQLAIWQGDANRDEQAAVTSAKHVAVCREMAASGQPDTDARLASAFKGHLLRLYALQRWHEALAVAQERVELVRRLAAEPSTADRTVRFAELAHALSDVAKFSIRVDRHAEAFSAGGEAIELYRATLTDLDDYGRYRYSQTLLNYADTLSVRERYADAMRAAADATHVFLDLDTDEYLADHREALLRFTQHATSAGKHDIARSATMRAHVIEQVLGRSD
jgi:tetratricopeptide (TPR) repeat protein